MQQSSESPPAASQSPPLPSDDEKKPMVSTVDLGLNGANSSSPRSPVSPHSIPEFGFLKAFDWNSNKVDVLIRHAFGAQIRASPQNHELTDHKGGQSDWSKWFVHTRTPTPTPDSAPVSSSATKPNPNSNPNPSDHNNNNNSDNPNPTTLLARFQNRKTRKYLCISKKGDEFNVSGDGNRSSEFRVYFEADGYKLESILYPGKYVSVRPHEGVEIRDGKSNNCLVELFMRGPPEEEGLFQKPYLFKHDNTVIIRHPQKAGLSITDKQLSDNGTKDVNSHWTAILPNPDDLSVVQFKHELTGLFIRISDAKTIDLDSNSSELTQFKVHVVTPPNIVKLESIKFSDSYIAVRAEGVYVGKGGPHSQMTILRKL